MSPAASTADKPSTKAAAAALTLSTTPRPGSRLAVEIAVPAGRTQTCHDQAVEKLSRSVKLPGFRKGKVPRAVLLQQIGALRIRATALEDLVDSVFRDALQQAEIAAIGQPALDGGFEALLERFEPGQELSLTLEMDVEPTPTLKTTKGLKAEATSVVFDPARVDELLEQSRRQLAALVPVEERPAAMGDVARIRFSGVFADSSEAIEGGSSDGMDVEMEEGRMIPGFVEGIVGLNVGGSRDVSCTFPESYPQEDAAGRPATFNITLIDLKTRELPELDDAFAQQASDKASFEELKTDLEERLKQDAERQHRANRQEALLEALVEQLEVELPETRIQQEMRNLVEQTASQIAQQGMDVKKVFTADVVRSLMDTSRPEAEKRLRRSLALRALAVAEKIEVPAAEVATRVTEVRLELSNQPNLDEEKLRLAVADDLLQEKLLEWLEAHATVSESAPATEGEAVDEKPEKAKKAKKAEGNQAADKTATP